MPIVWRWSTLQHFQDSVLGRVKAGLRRCRRDRTWTRSCQTRTPSIFFFGPRKRGVRPHPPNPPWLRAWLSWVSQRKTWRELLCSSHLGGPPQCAYRWYIIEEAKTGIWTKMNKLGYQTNWGLFIKISRAKRWGHWKARETWSALCMQWNECSPFLLSDWKFSSSDFKGNW